MKNKLQNGQDALPNKYLPPSPLEIARLAALLHGNEHLCSHAPLSAIYIALRLYVKAVDAYEHFSQMTEDNLLLSLASILDPTRKELHEDDIILEMHSQRQKKKSLLRLYSESAKLTATEQSQQFKNGLDGVRSYLTDNTSTANWKTVRTVLDTILRYCKYKAQEHNEEYKKDIAEYEKNFSDLYEEAAGKLARENKVRVADLSEQDRKKVRAYVSFRYKRDERQQRKTGKELYKDFMRGYAYSNPDYPQDEDYDPAIRDHRKKVEYDPTKSTHVIYWELPMQLLDELIAWRRKMAKTPGGVKQLDHLE